MTITASSFPLGNAARSATAYLTALPHRLALRYVRLRARLRILLRLTKRSTLDVKVMVWVAILYPVSPIKVVLEFVPVIGQVDELLIIAAVAWYCQRRDPQVARAIRNLVR